MPNFYSKKYRASGLWFPKQFTIPASILLEDITPREMIVISYVLHRNIYFHGYYDYYTKIKHISVLLNIQSPNASPYLTGLRRKGWLVSSVVDGKRIYYIAPDVYARLSKEISTFPTFAEVNRRTKAKKVIKL